MAIVGPVQGVPPTMTVEKARQIIEMGDGAAGPLRDKAVDVLREEEQRLKDKPNALPVEQTLPHSNPNPPIQNLTVEQAQSIAARGDEVSPLIRDQALALIAKENERLVAKAAEENVAPILIAPVPPVTFFSMAMPTSRIMTIDEAKEIVKTPNDVAPNVLAEAKAVVAKDEENQNLVGRTAKKS